MLGIVNSADFDKELEKSNRIIPRALPEPIANVVDKPVRGRKEGDNEVPDSLRKIIGEESEINGRQSALSIAKEFGISPSSVSAFANGSTSTASYDKRPNLPHINEAKTRVQNQARAKLTKALNFLDSSKLKDSKAVELSVIARNMAGIIRDMEPEIPNQGNTVNGNQVIQHILYAPQIKSEESYEVVRVVE